MSMSRKIICYVCRLINLSKLKINLLICLCCVANVANLKHDNYSYSNGMHHITERCIKFKHCFRINGNFCQQEVELLFISGSYIYLTQLRTKKQTFPKHWFACFIDSGIREVYCH